MTRRTLRDAGDFENLVISFKDGLIKEKKVDNNKDNKITIPIVMPKNIARFWLDFQSFRNRVVGAADMLARMDDKFRRLHGTTFLFGGLYMVYGSAKEFTDNIDTLLKEYEKVKDEIPDILSKFDNEEKLRIEEAYHSLSETCYWSSVINSAVALEKRLFVILKSRNTKFMKQRKSNLRFSLGELIGLYIDNKHKFKTCIPHRHDNLLTLINDYRIISAHSKQFDLDRATADAVLNLTLKFLIDDACTPVVRGKKKKP